MRSKDWKFITWLTDTGKMNFSNKWGIQMFLLFVRENLKAALQREMSRQMNNNNSGDIQIFSLHLRKTCWLCDINDGCVRNDNANHFAIHIYSLFGNKGLDFVGWLKNMCETTNWDCYVLMKVFASLRKKETIWCHN